MITIKRPPHNVVFRPPVDPRPFEERHPFLFGMSAGFIGSAGFALLIFAWAVFG